MSVLGLMARLASTREETERLQRKRPAFVPGAASRLWRRVRGMRRGKVLPLVRTRQNVRAGLRSEMYRRFREEHPEMRRCDRRKLARALAARAFRSREGMPAPEDCPLVRD